MLSFITVSSTVSLRVISITATLCKMAPSAPLRASLAAVRPRMATTSITTSAPLCSRQYTLSRSSRALLKQGTTQLPVGARGVANLASYKIPTVSNEPNVGDELQKLSNRYYYLSQMLMLADAIVSLRQRFTRQSKARGCAQETSVRWCLQGATGGRR